MKIAANIRERYDQTFMELVAFVRVQVLEAKPPTNMATSPIAQMFFQESQKSVLQDLAQLVAGWNDSQVDHTTIDRAASTLKENGLNDASVRLNQLKEITAS